MMRATLPHNPEQDAIGPRIVEKDGLRFLAAGPPFEFESPRGEGGRLAGLPGEGGRFAGLPGDGGRDGDPETFVFLHGWGARKELWWNALRSLPAGTRGISLDLPELLAGASMGTLAEWLYEQCSALGIGSATLVGHSLGGNLCAHAALQFPQLARRLVLVDAALTVAWLPARARWAVAPRTGMLALRLARAAAWPMALVGSRVPHAHAGGHWLPYARRAWLYVQGSSDCDLQQQMRLLLDNDITPQQLARARCPVLIVHGERDGIVPVEQARRFAAAVPGSTLRIMPRAMHCPMDWDPRAFTDYINEFLRATELGGGKEIRGSTPACTHSRRNDEEDHECKESHECGDRGDGSADGRDGGSGRP